MNIAAVSGGFSSITNGQSAFESARISSEKGKFESLLRSVKTESQVGMNVSSSNISKSGRLNGDYSTGFAGTFSSEADKNSLPSGAAANQANPHVAQKKIDRTSELYEKSLEMESYIVKIMLSSMRNTVIKAGGEDSYARKMYEDMLFDEYAVSMTKNAGFGLADQMYLQLSGFSAEA